MIEREVVRCHFLSTCRDKNPLTLLLHIKRRISHGPEPPRALAHPMKDLSAAQRGLEIEIGRSRVAQASSLWMSSRHPCLLSFGGQGCPPDFHRLEACATPGAHWMK